MAKKKQSNFRIPEDPSLPSGWAILILFIIPEFITKVIACGLLFKRIKNAALRNRLHLFRRYANAIGNSTTVSLRELAARMDMPTANLAEDLQAMIDEGYITGGAYIDYSHMTLHLDQATASAPSGIEQIFGMFVDPDERAHTVETAKASQARKDDYIPRETAEPEAPKRKQAEPVKRSTDSENFEAKLREIRELNEAIQDPAVSERIDRIGELTASIFRVVREKPEHTEEVRKFMNYYLPTTLKLLKSYSLMEKQSYQGETIQASRKKIEDVLDTLVRAFEQQQDRLFRTEALDVEADISVLETMMASDGLVEPQGGGLRMGGGGSRG